VQLYGPGDVVGIDPKAIVRTEPRHWITNFETNYLPFVEFYDEDFPWRYTPAAVSPDKRRLRPWVTLLVLKEAEFQDGVNVLGRPLPFIEVGDLDAVCPPADQLWAWAHVHVNGALGVEANDVTAVARRLGETVRADRDLAYARLLSPRILEPNAAYHAFVVPTFESGRLAGLGKDPALAPFATASAWAAYSGREESLRLPYYYRWYFRTSSVGDFEYLVRLLQPRTVHPRVGRRDVDVQKPDANLPGILELGGVLRLGGALRAPLSTLSPSDLEEYTRHEAWGRPYPHAFQRALAALVNLSDDYAGRPADQANAATGLGAAIESEEDPLIVPPIYGRWHAEMSRVTAEDADPSRRRWVEQLNLDPRHRAAAAFGTEIVQKNQETYVEAAWQQVGSVLAGNQKIRYGHLAMLTSHVWHARELTTMAARSMERWLVTAAPVQRRVLVGGLTVQHQVQRSVLPVAATSTITRRVLRTRGRVARKAGLANQLAAAPLLTRINAGEVSAAPPKVVAQALPLEEQMSIALMPPASSSEWFQWLERRLSTPAILEGVALVVALRLLRWSPIVAVGAGAALLGGASWLRRRVRRLANVARAARALDPETRTPESVDALPASSDFRVGVPGTTPAPTIGGSDSAEAVRFKESLRNLYAIDAAERAIPRPERRPIDLSAMGRESLSALHPRRTIPARVRAGVKIPSRIGDQVVDPFGEVMVYPEIDVPMYEPLKDLSSELFLPNIQLVENNSITLLETNQPFIESYMVGLNHEFARELLWREYPTDQRGSSFRQFWDVRGFLAEPGADVQVLRERLRDIPALHRWAKDTGLGDHDHREAQGDKEDELVLVIRGELLKRYPTAVIYAHRAVWERTSSGAIDKGQPRKLAPLSPAQDANPPRDLVKTPLYEAKVDPDLYFFGFDLTAELARGGQIVNSEEDPGWFFVIKERPGEPRFGLDLPKPAAQPDIHTWNELAWTDVMQTYAPGGFLPVGEKTVALTDPGSGSEAKPQHDEDRAFQWRGDTHAAEVAYILFQLPVLMAVHAAEMLKPAE
jgi:hypothetical protein